MDKILALLPEQPTRINATIVFIISAIALTMAAFGHYERQQWLGVAHDTAQTILPNLMNKQLTVRNLDRLRHYGDAVASDPHPMDRRRALDAARLLASHPSLADDHRVAPLVVEAEAHLARLAVTENERDAAVLRWEQLSSHLGEVADRIAVEATQEVASESERITALANQSRSRLLVILGAMALLMSLTLHLRRRQSATEASLSHAKLAHRWLEGENALLRLAADHTTDTMIFVHSTDVAEGLKLIYANAAFAQHLGYSGKEMSALAVHDFTDFSTDELAEQMTALKNAGTRHFETEHIVRDGRRVPVESSLNWIDHHGEPLVVGFCRDITARRAAEVRVRALEVEAALRLHERRYKEFFDAFSDGIFMLDVAADDRCLIAALNPVAERLMGVTSTEALGKCADELFPAGTAGFFVAQDRRCVDSGAPVHYEIWLDGPGGSRIHENTMVPLRDAAGRIHRVAGIIRDITGRVRMEQQLRDTAAQMRAFLDNIPDPAWIKDMDNRYLAVNLALVRQSGAAAPADVIGKLDLDFFPVNAARANLAHDMQVAVSGRQLRTEESGADRDGNESWFETIRSPMLDGEGNIVGTVGISRDITSRVHAQSQLEERQRVFRSLAENMPGNIARYSPDARIVYVNPGLERNLGCSLEDMVGKTPLESWPDGRFADYQKRVLAVAKSGYDSEMEMIVSLPDGMRQTHHVRFVAERDPKGSVVGVLALGTDITARRCMEDAIKAREREFRTLAETMPDNVVRYDRQCRVQYMNPAMAKGVVPESLPVLGKTPAETSPGIDAVADYQHFLEQVMATGEAAEMEIPTPHPGGEMRTHHVRFVAERDGNGEIVGALAIGRDITARKKTEALLEQREREYHSLAENLPDNIARWDAVGRILYSNPTHQRTLGKPVDELIGRTHGELFSDGRYDVVDEAIARIVATGETVEFVRAPELRENGETRMHDIKLAPEFDEAGRVVSVLGLGRDMTDSYRMQDAIAQREQEFRSLAESSPDFITRYDRAGHLLYVNDKLARKMGIPAVDLIGKFPQEVWPDGRFAEIDRAMVRAMAAAADETVELCEPAANGELNYVHIRVAPERDAAGQVIGAIAFGRDITDLKRYALSLARREREFRSLAENSPDVIVRYDRECRRIYVNPAHERRTGIGFAELLGKTPLEHWSLPTGAEGAAAFEANLRAVLASGRPGEWELSWTTADGASVHMALLGVPEYDETEQVIGVLTLARDITARRAMEDRLRMAASVFETTGEGIAITDLAGTILDVNSAFLDITGYSRDEVIGNNPRLLKSGRHDGKFYAAMWRLLKDNGVWSGEIVNRRKNGELYTEILSIAAVRDVDGLPRHYVCVFTDITVLKQAMEALRIKERSLVEAQRIGAMGSWELDLSSREPIWSDEMLRIFEIDTERVAAGPAQLLEATHPEDRDKVRAARIDALRNRTASEFEHRLLFADGRIKHVRERCETDYDAAARPLRLRGTVQDITAIKETERELNDSRDRMRELAAGIEATRESERKHLAREIHDELGQVLSALRMNVSMLRVKHGDARPAMTEAVQNIMVLVDRTIQTVRNVTSRLRPTALDMGVVPALEWLLSEFRTHSGLHCDLWAKEDDIVLDEEHATAVFRIVQETLTNVARHAEARRIEVALTQSDGELALTVRDDGKGFDPVQSRANAYGLVGMRERAEMMGGRLMVKSALGQGTAIELRIPAGGRP